MKNAIFIYLLVFTSKEILLYQSNLFFELIIYGLELLFYLIENQMNISVVHGIFVRVRHLLYFT